MPITIDKLYSTGNRSKDLFVLASLLRRQGKAKILVNVQYIHAQIITFGHESDTYLCNCLIQGYGDCGAVKEAQACFNAFNSNTFSWTLVIKAFAANGFLTEAMALFRMNPYKDVVTWNSTIAFLVKSDRCREALALFYEMPQEGIEVNNITFLCVIDSCIKLNSIDDGQRVCSIIETSRFRQNLVVCSALIKMFSKWGFVDKAREIFHSLPTRDVVLYTTMISMYAKLEDLVESLYLFQQMLALDMKTDVVLYVSLLDMCTTLRALDEGKQIHFILEVDNLAQNVMLATALINFYGKNTRVDDAEAVFEHQRQRDVVFLNAMITAYEQNNHGEKALILFHKLYVWHINPSIATFLCVLDACSSLSVLEEGKLIHSAITFEGYEINFLIQFALLNMYSKSGSAEDANCLFSRILNPNLITWNAMIALLSHNGQSEEALCLLSQMEIEGVEPDDGTFVSLLTACSHSGDVDRSICMFYLINKHYDLLHTFGHFLSLFDGLNRAGLLEEAEALISNMPLEIVGVAWRALLGACIIHGDEERGIHAASNSVAFEPCKALPYVMMSNLFTVARMTGPALEHCEQLNTLPFN